VVEGARLESDLVCTESVTKPHNSCGRTHCLSHFHAPEVTLCHTESTQESTQATTLHSDDHCGTQPVRGFRVCTAHAGARSHFSKVDVPANDQDDLSDSAYAVRQSAAGSAILAVET
jgi:hypothetical protein